MTNQSLNATLAALGYTTGAIGNPLAQGKAVYRDGVHQTSGSAGHVWHWLRAQGHDLPPCSVRARGEYCDHCEDAS